MTKKTIIIGISGATASGKSLLANTLVSELGSKRVAVISEDSYYKDRPDLSDEQRRQINYDHPEAFDHELLCEHLMSLCKGLPVQVPIYDHSKDARSDKSYDVKKSAIVVLEGILLLSDPLVRELLDIKIFMDTPLDICLIRRLKRDIIQRGRSLESVLQQYERTVRPMYWQFVEPSKRYADIIVPRGGENRIAIEMIKAKMQDLLNNAPQDDTTEKMS